MHLKVGSLDAYLSATGEFQAEGAAGGDICMEGPADQSTVEGHDDLCFVDSDTESTPPDNLEGHLLGVLDAHRGGLPVNVNDLEDSDDDLEDNTDQKPPEPLDVNRMIHILTEMRVRGGDFEGDGLAGDEDGDGANYQEDVPDEVNIDGKLAEPVWKTEEPCECQLKLLQVSALRAVHTCYGHVC
jgi:hypothetical protein